MCVCGGGGVDASPNPETESKAKERGGGERVGKVGRGGAGRGTKDPGGQLRGRAGQDLLQLRNTVTVHSGAVQRVGMCKSWSHPATITSNSAAPHPHSPLTLLRSDPATPAVYFAKLLCNDPCPPPAPVPRSSTPTGGSPWCLMSSCGCTRTPPAWCHSTPHTWPSPASCAPSPPPWTSAAAGCCTWSWRRTRWARQCVNVCRRAQGNHC